MKYSSKNFILLKEIALKRVLLKEMDIIMGEWLDPYPNTEDSVDTEKDLVKWNGAINRYLMGKKLVEKVEKKWK